MIAVGVCGGIGAYKSVEVVRGLQKLGHDVVAVMTRSARRFVGELTFEAITRHRVLKSQFEPGANADIEHIALASSIDLLIVAPATANILGKFANGIADDFLTSLYLATKAPVLVAPAMNTNMLEHAAVQRNLEVLAARGTYFVEPGAGYLACGWIGKGRLAEPADIVRAAEQLLTPVRSAARQDRHRHGRADARGHRSGAIRRQPIERKDGVRACGRRPQPRRAASCSSAGRRIFSLLPGVELIRVTTAAEMRDAVVPRAAHADVVIMAAAVADYAPAAAPQQKIHKDSDTLTLTLVRTPDILAELGKQRAGGERPLLVGFAAETTDVVASARRKQREKGVDLVVANDVSRADAGFEVDTNEVTLVSADGEETLPLQPKSAIAAQVMQRIEKLLTHSRPPVRT